MNGAEADIAIKWRWTFEGKDSVNYATSQSDVTDTTLGTAGTATITVSAKITATQID